jgi:hypothetical protein
MQKQFPDPLQPGRDAEQESFTRYTDPHQPEQIDPQPERGNPTTEPDTRPEPEVQPVRDGEENKSPLRPIDENKAPEDFGLQERQAHQDSGLTREGNKSHGPVVE